jgi:hypothetical protein
MEHSVKSFKLKLPPMLKLRRAGIAQTKTTTPDRPARCAADFLKLAYSLSLLYHNSIRRAFSSLF